MLTSIVLPATDTVVWIEAVVLAVVSVTLLLVLRRKPTGRLLVAGVTVFVAALMALRTVH